MVGLALAASAAACGGQEEAESEIADIERGPDTPIVIPADEPIIIGVSTALTGPIAAGGSEHRDAVVVGVERWKAANGDRIGGHQIEIRAEDDGCTEADVAAAAARRRPSPYTPRPASWRSPALPPGLT